MKPLAQLTLWKGVKQVVSSSKGMQWILTKAGLKLSAS
jgi:hypothetical protein